MQVVRQDEGEEQWWCRRDQSQKGEFDWLLEQSAIPRRTWLDSGNALLL